MWNKLLQKHVSHEGWVNYEGFIKDSLELNAYLDLLSNNHPNKKYWSKDQEMAYWINAYNAFTIRIVIRNYPLKNIKNIGGKIYRLNTTWAIKFIRIESEIYSLDQIEHNMLRKQFYDPRIHFAVNCASISCPKLSNKAYTAENLNNELNRMAKEFINDTLRNNTSKGELSKIFSWYKGDFTKSKSLVEYINQFANTPVKKEQKITYLDYNWMLNDIKNKP